MEKGEISTSIFAVGKDSVPGLVEMVSVDGEVGDSGLKAVVKGVGNEGLIGKWDEWFWKSSGQRLEAGSQSSSEEEGFAHEQRMI